MRSDLRRLARLRRAVRWALIALIVAALAVAAALVPYRLLLPAVALPERGEDELRLHFLSVGQGDCTIAEFPSGAVLVIDAGDGSFANDDYIVRYIKGLAPASLMLAATHADSDHYGGLTELLRVFDVEKVYLPAVGSETGAYARLLSAVERIAPYLLGAKKGSVSSVCANVDLYSGLVYKMLGIPEELFTPLFAVARMAGWCAHRIEEVTTCRRIVRPAYKSVQAHTDYIPLSQRKR